MAGSVVVVAQNVWAAADTQVQGETLRVDQPIPSQLLHVHSPLHQVTVGVLMTLSLRRRNLIVVQIREVASVNASTCPAHRVH